MKIILQKVKNAGVRCLDCKKENQKKFSSIKEGILIYVGISKECNEDKIKRAVNKILNIKIFHEEERFQANILEKKFEILVISNFTINAKIKGRRLNFNDALNPNDAKICFEKFVNELKKNYDKSKIKVGFFRNLMNVKSELEGPLNLILEF